MSRILEYIQEFDYESFKSDQKTVDAVIRNFEIIGEATNKLPGWLKEKYPDMPWSSMYRLRNRLTHEYFGIDHEIIWRISTVYLPTNLDQINFILKNEKGD